MPKTKPTDRIRRVIQRFPEHEESIRELHVTNTGFETLCDRHHRVSEEIDELQKQGGAGAEDLDNLKRRRVALEEEIMGILDAGTRM